MSRLFHLARFYSTLGVLQKRLGGVRRLSQCSGRMSWPRRGVHFFMERGELPTDTGEGRRVVRVGTHGLGAGPKTQLRTRLRSHRGPASSGRGNHRGSTFRLLVGTALMEGDGGFVCRSWDDGRGSAPRDVREHERHLEVAVSTVIGDMPILWLPVEDSPGPDSLCEYVERDAISLLSNHRTPIVDPPSDSWLGHHCNWERVQLSGLWNSSHVDGTYEPAFVNTMARLVDRDETQAC